MGFSTVIILGLAALGIVLAIAAFLTTPKERRYKNPKFEYEEGVNYAPEYSARERMRKILLILTWVAPTLIAYKLWFLPWLGEYTAQAHCDNYGPFTGAHIIFYGLFIGLPASMGIAFFVLEGKDILKIYRLGQYPLPTRKVFRPTKYVYGFRPRFRAVASGVILLAILGVSIWGYFAANEIINLPKPDASDCVSKLVSNAKANDKCIA